MPYLCHYQQKSALPLYAVKSVKERSGMQTWFCSAHFIQSTSVDKRLEL